MAILSLGLNTIKSCETALLTKYVSTVNGSSITARCYTKAANQSNHNIVIFTQNWRSARKICPPYYIVGKHNKTFLQESYHIGYPVNIVRRTATTNIFPAHVFHGWGESFPKKDEDERNRLFYTADLVVESEPPLRAFNLARNLFSSACLYVYIYD